MGDYDETKHPRGDGGKFAPGANLAKTAHALSHAAAAGPASNDAKGHADHAELHKSAAKAHQAAGKAMLQAAVKASDAGKAEKSDKLLGEHARHQGAAIAHEHEARLAQTRGDIAKAHDELQEASSKNGMKAFVDKHTKGDGEKKEDAHGEHAEHGDKKEGGSNKHEVEMHAGGHDAHKEHEENEHRESIAEWMKEKLEEGREAVHEAGEGVLEYDPLKKFAGR